MNLFEKVQAENWERYRKLEQGKPNCIPIPFKRFQDSYPGVEQGKYIILTANQKVGKSKLADFLFIYQPLLTMLENPELKVKVLYFTLEMTPEEKMREFECFLLQYLGGEHISPSELRCVQRKCDPRLLHLVESAEYRKYINAYLGMIEFDDTNKNPTGIRKRIEKFAMDYGHENYIKAPEVDPVTGIETPGEIDPINPYIPNDPDLYQIVILDNASNFSGEENALYGKLDTPKKIIEKVSKDLIMARNRYKMIIILIQHQAQAQEGIENIKLGRTKPSSDGLGDCKTTSRDANCVMGLYNPLKFLKEGDPPFYKNYNLSLLKGYCRFLEVLEDRDYGSGGVYTALLFDGATCKFEELPLPSDEEGLRPFYRYIEEVEALRRRRRMPEQNDLVFTNPK